MRAFDDLAHELLLLRFEKGWRGVQYDCAKGGRPMPLGKKVSQSRYGRAPDARVSIDMSLLTIDISAVMRVRGRKPDGDRCMMHEFAR
jgi:hypothetical protein